MNEELATFDGNCSDRFRHKKKDALQDCRTMLAGGNKLVFGWLFTGMWEHLASSTNIIAAVLNSQDIPEAEVTEAIFSPAPPLFTFASTAFQRNGALTKMQKCLSGKSDAKTPATAQTSDNDQPRPRMDVQSAKVALLQQLASGIKSTASGITSSGGGLRFFYNDDGKKFIKTVIGAVNGLAEKADQWDEQIHELWFGDLAEEAKRTAEGAILVLVEAVLKHAKSHMAALLNSLEFHTIAMRIHDDAPLT